MGPTPRQPFGRSTSRRSWPGSSGAPPDDARGGADGTTESHPHARPRGDLCPAHRGLQPAALRCQLRGKDEVREARGTGGPHHGTIARAGRDGSPGARNGVSEPELEVHGTGLYRRHDYRRGGGVERASHQAGVSALDQSEAADAGDSARGGGVVLHVRAYAISATNDRSRALTDAQPSSLRVRSMSARKISSARATPASPAAARP